MLTDFPPEILDQIWMLCDRKSLRSISLCSTRCYNLVGHILFRNIEISWQEVNKARKVSQDPLKFARCLKFSESERRRSIEWKNISQDFQMVISYCDSSRLRELTIVDKVVYRRDLVTIFDTLINLKTIELSCSRDIRNGLITLPSKSFSTFEDLQKLSLSHCHFSYTTLSNVFGLAELEIMDSVVPSDAMIDNISQIKDLRKLTLIRIKVQSTKKRSTILIPLAKLVGLTSLEHLNITDSAISSEEDLVTLMKSLTSLKALIVSGIKLTLSIDVFCCLPSLHDLGMRNCDLSHFQLSSISKLKSLRSLDVSENERLTDIGLGYIGQLVSLEHLNIRGTRYSNHGPGLLTSLVLLKTLVMNSWANPITAKHLENIPSLQNMYDSS